MTPSHLWNFLRRAALGPLATQAAPGNTAPALALSVTSPEDPNLVVVGVAGNAVTCSQNYLIPIANEVVNLAGTRTDTLTIQSRDSSARVLNVDCVALHGPNFNGCTGLTTINLPNTKYYYFLSVPAAVTAINAPNLEVFIGNGIGLPSEMTFPKVKHFILAGANVYAFTNLDLPEALYVGLVAMTMSIVTVNAPKAKYFSMTSVPTGITSISIPSVVFLESFTCINLISLTLPAIGVLKAMGNVAFTGSCVLSVDKMTELLALAASLTGVAGTGTAKYMSTINLTATGQSAPTYTGTPQAIASLVGASTYVDVTTAAPHGKEVGNAFTVYGSSIAAQNGTYRVASLDGVTPLTKFRYTKTAVGTSTGSPVLRNTTSASDGNLHYVHLLVKQGATVIYNLPA